jgi:hypothetical protein
VLLGGGGVGTVLTLLFLPALYSLWFKVRRNEAATAASVAPRPALFAVPHSL